MSLVYCVNPYLITKYNFCKMRKIVSSSIDITVYLLELDKYYLYRNTQDVKFLIDNVFSFPTNLIIL